MKPENKIHARPFSILCVLISAGLALFAPWAVIRGNTLTLPELFFAIFSAGGIESFVDSGDTAAFATLAMTYVAALSLILYGIYGILLILKKKVRLLGYISYFLYFVYICAYMTFQGHESGFALPFCGLVMLIEFMIFTYLEQSSEINRNYRMLKQREREERAERKRRLYFPGKYPPDFLKCHHYRSLQ